MPAPAKWSRWSPCPTSTRTNRATASDDAKFDRATLGVYEMGSTFKIFNTALALDSGRVHLTDKFDTVHAIHIGHFTITDFHPANHWYDVKEIMEESSNLGAVHMFEQVGVEAQQAFLTKLGLTRQAKLEVPERGMPMVPRPWRDINGMTIAFGHGIAVSPLHLVRGVGAIVNGGVLLQPTLLKRDESQPAIGERVISQQTSDEMRDLMRAVVTNGTAKSANTPGYDVGGKTGTADKLNASHKYGGVGAARMSSFAGAFPMSNPRYVVYVMIDEPHANAKSYGFATGGWVAAPAVGKIVAQMAPLLGIAPQLNPDGTAQMQLPAATAPVMDDEAPSSALPTTVDTPDNDADTANLVPAAPNTPKPPIPFMRDAQPIAYRTDEDGVDSTHAAPPPLPAAARFLRR